jgi:hypothetical protein
MNHYLELFGLSELVNCPNQIVQTNFGMKWNNKTMKFYDIQVDTSNERIKLVSPSVWHVTFMIGDIEKNWMEYEYDTMQYFYEQCAKCICDHSHVNYTPIPFYILRPFLSEVLSEVWNGMMVSKSGLPRKNYDTREISKRLRETGLDKKDFMISNIPKNGFQKQSIPKLLRDDEKQELVACSILALKKGYRTLSSFLESLEYERKVNHLEEQFKMCEF